MYCIVILELDTQRVFDNNHNTLKTFIKCESQMFETITQRYNRTDDTIEPAIPLSHQ